ncbi:mitogen-activated protein kinase 4-like [Paramacrobiotus metropolitanus]|uniref:mitogen-activated protein kinase 4-like n=1 Tax=Paramacrobiotus metropolitanus TaxID=2943436 RepID=UPI0024456A1F|nr:mitogen-activated protein kinase 4-like [Paramacrobiotus metropolitanus]
MLSRRLAGLAGTRYYRNFGSGTFGRVYKGKITRPGNYKGAKIVAVKRIELGAVTNQETWEKKIDRLRQLPTLVHDNIVPCHLVRITKNIGKTTVEIMMELCESDLACCLKKATHSSTGHETYRYDDVERYCKEITAGVDLLHQRNIIHGDLKPANILTKDLPNGRKRLLIGDLEDLVHMQESVTCSGDITQLHGTFSYMSPEMLKKFSMIRTESPGRKTDVWCLGCIMLEIAERCLGSKTDKKLLQKNGEQITVDDSVSMSRYTILIIDGYVPFVSADIPRKLAACIQLCLKPAPNQRVTAGMLLDKLSLADIIP